MTSIESNSLKDNSRVLLNHFEDINKKEFEIKFYQSRKNHTNKHGFHYRSSAQFYYVINKQEAISSSLILFNYFQIKNNNRCDMRNFKRRKGKFIDRKHINFEDQNVLVIDSEFWGIDNHLGSVEVEYFSLKNLVIPYAAVIGVYETQSGISYIHTYSRCYSCHEIETGFTVMESCESNWTIRDSNDIESFTILHNGFLKVDKQDIKIQITTETGRITEKAHKIDALNPYEIVEIVPQKIFEDLSGWLNEEQANCSIKFKINGAFTRTLVGNRTKSHTDMQVTHSNFAYNHHKTDFVDTHEGYMPYPNFNVRDGQINIYPDMPTGKYFISFDCLEEDKKNFLSGEYISYKINQEQNFNISLGKTNSELPSRIPIGFSGKSLKASDQILPFEISLGIYSKVRPKKRFWWGPIGNNQTKILWFWGSK